MSQRFREQSLIICALDVQFDTTMITGVAGLFDGEEAVSSIAVVHVFEWRIWFGWYNTLGSYIMGARFNRLAHFAVPSLSEDNQEYIQTDLTSLFEYNGQKNSKFRAVYFGTAFQETGHLAALFMKACTVLHAILIEGRETHPVDVTVANFDHVPPAGRCTGVVVLSTLAYPCFGISCLVISSGSFRFMYPEPAPGSPPGDGVLGCGEGIVLLKGKEGADIAQLILVPQSSPFGQLIPLLTKSVLGTRTSMAIFVLLALDLDDPEDVMDFLLSPNTRAWQIWKGAVIKRLRNHERLSFDALDWDGSSLSDQERQMLETLSRDAQDAYEGFQPGCEWKSTSVYGFGRKPVSFERSSSSACWKNCWFGWPARGSEVRVQSTTKIVRRVVELSFELVRGAGHYALSPLLENFRTDEYSMQEAPDR
ncbi:hypothetical protein EDC04DRAFT_2602474 [Pisolithus marmoratus]|nr:hypothetical protein EDC04DRAFT_2602474 [Pisolithus marmoratus]